MNLIAICQSANEQDIIETWVRHHLKLMDKILIFDGSLDDSKRILASLVEEFPDRLIVEHQEKFGDAQASQMTALLHRSAQWNPDYVFPLDADEFIGIWDEHIGIYSEKRILEVELDHLAGRLGRMPWKTYICIDGWRRTEESPFWKVVIPGKDVLDLGLSMGNHGVSSLSGKSLPDSIPIDISLLHFPVRSMDQFLSKTVVGWMARLAVEPDARNSGLGYHRRQAFDALTSGEDINLIDYSVLYAQETRRQLCYDPPPICYERRYSTGRAMPAVQLIARAWEKSL